MEEMTILKFENETDEANWLYENREGLASAFLQAAQKGGVRQGTLKRRAQVESILPDGLQTKKMVVMPEELTKVSLASVLREKLDGEISTDKGNSPR
jgi:hypothetical protein